MLVRLAAKLFNKIMLRLSNPQLTDEATAPLKVHALHADGKVQLGDIPCEKEDGGSSGERGGRRTKDKMRNEEASAAGRLKRIK